MFISGTIILIVYRYIVRAINVLHQTPAVSSRTSSLINTVFNLICMGFKFSSLYDDYHHCH